MEGLCLRTANQDWDLVHSGELAWNPKGSTAIHEGPLFRFHAFVCLFSASEVKLSNTLRMRGVGVATVAQDDVPPNPKVAPY